jgi:hypothetical protein
MGGASTGGAPPIAAGPDCKAPAASPSKGSCVPLGSGGAGGTK